jgi:hypothetical protein
MANASFSTTQNSIANISMYNEETGGWTHTSDNINGNWNARGGFSFNTPLWSKKFKISTSTDFSYSNNVTYLTVDKDTKRNKTIDMNLNERLGATYRNDWLEVGLNASLSYSWEKNKLRPENDQEPYTYSYGANLQVYMPWDLTLTTNISDQARRGYADATMNKNELIWNAQLSKRISRSASVNIELYDILKQQSNITRRLTANGRSVYEYNGITHYCMVHFIYRLNIFGNKDARRGRMHSREGGSPGRQGGGPGRERRGFGREGGMGGMSPVIVVPSF